MVPAMSLVLIVFISVSFVMISCVFNSRAVSSANRKYFAIIETADGELLIHLLFSHLFMRRLR